VNNRPNLILFNYLTNFSYVVVVVVVVVVAHGDGVHVGQSGCGGQGFVMILAGGGL